MVQASRLPVKRISKKLSEGHPNVIDIIGDGKVNGVVNTVTGDRIPLRDGFEIRRVAAENRIPCFTSLGGRTTIYSLSPAICARQVETLNNLDFFRI
jgi:carbamoyl-phosphate synthase large subunit